MDHINDRDEQIYQNKNFETFKNTNQFPDINTNSESPYKSNPIDENTDRKNLAYSFKQDKESSIHKISNDFINNQYNYNDRLGINELKSEKFNSQ